MPLQSHRGKEKEGWARATVAAGSLGAEDVTLPFCSCFQTPRTLLSHLPERGRVLAAQLHRKAVPGGCPTGAPTDLSKAAAPTLVPTPGWSVPQLAARPVSTHTIL